MRTFAILEIIFAQSFIQNIQTHGCRYLSTSLQLQLCIPASNNSPLYAELLAVSVLQLEMPNVLFKLKSSMFCCIGSTDWECSILMRSCTWQNNWILSEHWTLQESVCSQQTNSKETNCERRRRLLKHTSCNNLESALPVNMNLYHRWLEASTFSAISFRSFWNDFARPSNATWIMTNSSLLHRCV